jgi:hypothetical protein
MAVATLAFGLTPARSVLIAAGRALVETEARQPRHRGHRPLAGRRKAAAR